MIQRTHLAADGRPLIFGEVLYDVFPGGDAVLGGAPFNVAWHLQGLGLAPVLVSAVGEDDSGRRVLETMGSWSMTTDGVAVDPGHPTGQVAITMHGKDARFDIRPDQAYDHINRDMALRLGAQKSVSLLYHGSLIVRSPQNEEILGHLVETTGLPAFVDVNLRAPWWSPEKVTGMVARARWVKLNGEELAALVPGTEASRTGVTRAAEGLRSRYNLELVIVTLGADGALICTGEGVVKEKAPQPKALVDTVGAGDSFSAVTIYGLHRGWPPAVILKRALSFASAVVAQRGATSRDETLYSSHLDAWNAE